MINQKSAQTLIDSMSHLFRIDMSIINERGVIIASNQIKLIGKFHPIANEMIEQRLKEKVERTPTGAIIKRYLLLMQESHPYGVISISGSGADNDQLVQLLQYDVKKQLIPQIDRQRTNINGMSEIFNSLFRESPVNYEKVNEAFFKYHYSLNALRLPALVHFTNASGTDAAYKRLKQVLDEDAQNMMFRYSEYDILFFVRLSYKESLHPRTAELERAITQATASISSYKLAYTVPTDDIRFYGISFSQLVSCVPEILYLGSTNIADLPLINGLVEPFFIYLYARFYLTFSFHRYNVISMEEVLPWNYPKKLAYRKTKTPCMYT